MPAPVIATFVDVFDEASRVVCHQSSVCELARDLTRASPTGYFPPSAPVQQYGEARQPGPCLQ